MVDNPKTTCCAFGCRRWTRRFPASWEYLCPDHWAMVPRRLRRLYSRAKRRADRYGGERDVARVRRLWAKCKAATERNIGL